MTTPKNSAPEPKAMQRHVAETYKYLRFGMAGLAFVFPVLLVLAGVVLHWLGPPGVMPDPVMSSMSAYYHTPLRGVFVGLLYAIGFYLYLYKGFSVFENRWLNLAGTFAILVAMLPTKDGCQCPCDTFTTRLAHGVCAVLFFATIVFVCRRSAAETLPLLKDEARNNWYSKWYRALGVAIIVLPLLISVFTLLVQRGLAPENRTIGLVAETLAIWTFALYWYRKGQEIEEIRAQDAATSET